MTISIIGTATVGSTLARLFARAGVKAQIANTRGPSSIDLDHQVADAITPVDLSRALEADIVIAAVPFAAMETLGRSVQDWNGRVVVDVTNAFGVDAQVLGGRSSSEHNADFFKGAAFVKAMNHLPYNVYETAIAGQDGRRAVFVSGDDANANEKVSGVARDLGFAPLDLGRLSIGGDLLRIGGPLLMKNLVEYPF